MKIRLSTLIMLIGFPAHAITFAGPINIYQDCLVNNKLTIRYESCFPLERDTNRNKVEINGKSGMNLDSAHFLTNQAFKGIVVVNGDDKYEEISTGRISVCRLIKEDKVYFFSKEIKGDKTIYYGNEGKGKVSASGRNLKSEHFSGYSYGDESLTRSLNAILPLELMPNVLPVYHRIAEGRLGNCFSYVDLCTEQNEWSEAFRYYFSGNKLVKIIGLSLTRDNQGKEVPKKALIKIEEFSPNVLHEYLSLPKELKEVNRW